MPERTLITLSSPGDVIAAIPYLVGYHPDHSLVVIALRDKRMLFSARCDLPEGPEAADAVGDLIATIATRHKLSGVIVAGYGPAHSVTTVIDAARIACDTHGLALREALRVTDGRYWSYTCGPTCDCPTEGIPVPIAGNRVAAELVAAGEVALPDRASLAESITPDPAAVAAVSEHLARSIDRTTDEAAVSDRLTHHHSAGTFPEPAETARILSWLRDHPHIADHAMRHIDAHSPGRFVELLRWLVRHAPTGYAAEPATLLAFAAWRTGNGALARVACQHALRDAPRYRPAHLIEQLLDSGADPTTIPPLVDIVPTTAATA